MRLLPLLFDPRGVVDRRAFWSGLLQLTLLSFVVWAGLTRLAADGALAALPAIGETFVVGGLAGCAYWSGAPDALLATSFLLVAARLYATACLMLKRSRDAGGGPRSLVVFGLAGLLIHVLMGLWAYDLYDEGMAMITPLIADVAATTLIWAIVLTWTGARPSLSRKNT